MGKLTWKDKRVNCSGPKDGHGGQNWVLITLSVFGGGGGGALSNDCTGPVSSLEWWYSHNALHDH